MSTFKFEYEEDPKPFSEFKIIPEGEGEFEIVDAAVGKSKSSGNAQMIFKIRIYSQGQNTLYMKYVQYNQPYIIKAMAEAIGHPEIYNKTAELEVYKFLNGAGTCVIKTEVSNNPRFPDKSVISKFIPREPIKYSAPVEDNDELPF